MKKISILGLGYVGLSTAACFAQKSFKVIGVDTDKQKISMINERKAPFYEPGLDELLKASVDSQMLHCTEDCRYALENCARNQDEKRIDIGTSESYWRALATTYNSAQHNFNSSSS